MSGAPASPARLRPADPFDLPEWLGTDVVSWRAEAGLRGRSLVPGTLSAPERDDLPCDLLAVDGAYPAPVAEEPVRVAAHRSWHHGEVFLLDGAIEPGRLTLAAPGIRFDADLVLDVLGRLARAVGAPADHYGVLLRIGSERRPGG